MEKVLQFKPMILAMFVVGTAGTLVMKNKPDGQKVFTPTLDKTLTKAFPVMALVGAFGFLALSMIESKK